MTRPIDKPNLEGFKIRVTPIYRAFFASMGATMIRTKPGDVYTALERGTVDGYGWPSQGIFDLGWDSVTKYRVDPAFYRVSVEILVNLDVWTQLDDQQRKILSDAGAMVERTCEADQAQSAAELKQQVEAGIKVIEFKGEEGRQYLESAYSTGWDEYVKNNPEHGPKIKALLSR